MPAFNVHAHEGGDNPNVDWGALQTALSRYEEEFVHQTSTFPTYYETQDQQNAFANAQGPKLQDFMKPEQGATDYSTLWSKSLEAAKPLPDAKTALTQQNYTKLFGQRASWFQMQVWSNKPYLFAQLVTARYREGLIKDLAKQVPSMHDWIARQNEFGGVSGGLTRLRVRALNIPDPVVRTYALYEIDQLTNLSTEDQQAFLAWARTGDASSVLAPSIANKPIVNYEGENVGAGGTVVTPSDVVAETAPIEGAQALFGDQAELQAGQVVLHSKIGQGALDPVQQAALDELFPALSGRFGRVVSPQDVVDSIKQSQGFQQTYEMTNGKIFDPGATPLDQLEGIFNAAFVGPGAAIKGGSKLGSAVYRSKIANDLTFGASDSFADVVGSQARLAEHAQQGVVDFIGDGADYVYHAATGNHMAAETKQFVGNVALVIILHEVAEAGGALKTTMAGPAEFTRGQVGFEGGTYTDVLRGAANDPVAAAMHPIATFLDPLTQQSVYNMVQIFRSTALEDWVGRGAASKFFGYVESTVKDLGPEAARAALMRRYPALSRNAGWADAMVDAAQHGQSLSQATLDYAARIGSKDVSAALEANATKLTEVQGKIDSAGRGTIPVEEGRLPSVEEVARANEAQQPLEFTGYHGNAEGPVTPTVEGGGGLASYAFDRNFAESYAGGVAENVTQHTLYANKIWDLRADATSEVKAQLLQTLTDRGVDVDAPQWSLGGKTTSVRSLIEQAQTVEDLDKVAPYIGPRAVTSMQDLVGATEQAGGGIGGVNPSDVWMRDTLKDMGFDGEIRPDLNEAGAGWEFRSYRDLYEPVGTPDVAGLGELYDQLTDLQAERAILRNQQVDLYTRTAPIYEFPTQRTLTNFLHKVLFRPSTVTEKIFRFVLNPLRDVKRFVNYSTEKLFSDHWLSPDDQAFVAKLVDKLGADDRLRAPMAQMSPGSRAAATDMNVTYLNRLFQRFGVSEEDATATLGRVVGAKSTQEFWDAVTHDVFGQDGVLSKYLPRNTPKAWADQFLNRYDVNSLNLRGYNIVKLPDGTTKYEPLIPGETRMGVPQSLPGAPSEFASYIPLPSVGELDRILSGFRRTAENLKHAQRFTTLARGTAWVMDMSRATLHMSTSVLKPFALIANLPAIIMTKQVDEALGNAMSPNVRGIMHAGREADSLVGPIDPSITGNAIAGMFYDNKPGVPVIGEVATRDILQNGIDSAQGQLVFATRAKLLNNIHNDWWMRQFAEDMDEGSLHASMARVSPSVEEYAARDNIAVELHLDPSLGDGVDGWAEPGKIAVVHGPDTPQSVIDATAMHELGHHHLVRNGQVADEGMEHLDEDAAWQHAKAVARDIGYEWTPEMDSEAAAALHTYTEGEGPAAGPYSKFKARIESDPMFMRHFNENLKPILDRAGMDLDTYLERLESFVREVTFDHPDYLGYVKTGHMAPGGSLGRSWDSEIMPQAAASWEALQEEAGLVREALAKLNPEKDASAIRAHQARLRKVLEAADGLREDISASGLDFGDKVSLLTPERPGALASDIAKRFENGEVSLPDVTKVDTSARPLMGLKAGKGLPELADDLGSKIGQWMYGRDGLWSFRRIGEFEGRYARGSYYEQRALQYAKGFRQAGMSEADALEFGRIRAGVEAKDIFYDLTARSTTERSLRNIFWFAPVNAELLYRWLYAIPAQAGGLIPGALITLARASAWKSLLSNVGLIHKDEFTGQDVIPISGLGKLIETLSGGSVKIPDTLEIPLASLNPHLSSPIPQLAPLPALALNTAAGSRFGKYAPVLKTLSQAVAPHAYVTFVPSSIRNVLAVAGVKLPDFSQDYINNQWDRTHDLALQYAYHDLLQQGVKAPQFEDYNDQDAYLKDWNAWFDRLNSTANDYARGLYVVSSLSSAVLPGYIVATDKDKAAYEKWYNDTIKPQVTLDNGTTSDETRQKMNRWLAKHPESLAYSISYGYYTGKTWQPDLAKTDSEYYTQLYLHGVKDTMPPEEYGKVLAAMTSKAYYDSKLEGQLNRIAPDGKASTLLRNWGERARAIEANRLAWQNYLKLHPDADGIIKTHQAAMADQYGIPTEDIQRQYVQDALDGLQSLSGVFTGEDRLPMPEYTTIISKLKELNSKLYTQTGGNLDPQTQGVSWYFDNVLDPYFERTQKLYDKASKLGAAGLSTASIYRQIDKIKNDYAKPSYNGEAFPGIDEFFWGTKTKRQQQTTLTSWMTKPVSWLSDWQRRKVGYQSFDGEDHMFAELANLDDRTAKFIEENDVSSGSKWMDSIQAWQQRQERSIAEKYGDAGIKALNLEQASPYERLRYFNYGANNDAMQNVYKMVDYAQKTLVANDLSAGGYSEYGIDLKLWIYSYIAQQENRDPKFLDLMQHLSDSTAPMGGATFHPTGVPLWEAVFFGNYNPSFIPQNLIDAAPRGPNVT